MKGREGACPGHRLGPAQFVSFPTGFGQADSGLPVPDVARAPGGRYAGVAVEADHRRAGCERDGAGEATSKATGDPCAMTWLNRPRAALVGPYRSISRIVDVAVYAMVAADGRRDLTGVLSRRLPGADPPAR